MLLTKVNIDHYWLGLVLLVSIVQYSIAAFNVTGNPEVNLYAITVLSL